MANHSQAETHTLTDDEAQLIPIRQLSELTNVNTVTIRAWERRYGLLKPARTSKGHRLYSQEDVKRVQAILAFISKGVPVGKVKSLLLQEYEQDGNQEDDSWRSLIEKLESDLRSHSKAQRNLRDLFLNYPANLCYREVIEPLFTKLKARPQTLAEQAILESAIVSYSLTRLNAKAIKNPRASVTLVCANQSPMWKLAICALELYDANIKVDFFNQALSLTTLIMLTEYSTDTHCVIYNEGVWKSEDEEKMLTLSAQHKHVVFCGTAALLSPIDAERKLSSPHKILEYLNKVLTPEG